jgi:hypothetical protein
MGMPCAVRRHAINNNLFLRNAGHHERQQLRWQQKPAICAPGSGVPAKLQHAYASGKLALGHSALGRWTRFERNRCTHPFVSI